MRALFVTWDGPGLAYLESLFVPIFARLRKSGHSVDVLQFGWGDSAGVKRARATCETAGIGYCRVEIRRKPRPIGPFMSAIGGGRAIRAAISAFGSELLIPRSIMPALATLAAGTARLPPIVYDADGLEADERVDFAGLSRAGITYRVMRAVEARIVRASRRVLTRSAFASDVLSSRARVAPARFQVVRNGRDADLFQPGDDMMRAHARAKLGVAPDAPLLAYVGSIGVGKYDTARIAHFARAMRARRADTRLLVLTTAPDAARAIIGAEAPDIARDMILRIATPADVPVWLATADVGAAFFAERFSMRAVAPIKTAEYLLCGVPVVGTSAVGDTAASIAADVFFDDRAGLDVAAHWVETRILPQRDRARARAREVGVAEFSLGRSADDYARALATSA